MMALGTVTCDFHDMKRETRREIGRFFFYCFAALPPSLVRLSLFPRTLLESPLRNHAAGCSLAGRRLSGTCPAPAILRDGVFPGKRIPPWAESRGMLIPWRLAVLPLPAQDAVPAATGGRIESRISRQAGGLSPLHD